MNADNILKEIYAATTPVKGPCTVERDEDGVYIFKDADGRVIGIAGQQFVDALEKEFMSHEDNTPIELHAEGWETLPDGRHQLLIECRTIVDFATMPKSIKLGEDELFKMGWDETRKVAFFRTGGIEDLQGKVEVQE